MPHPFHRAATAALVLALVFAFTANGYSRETTKKDGAKAPLTIGEAFAGEELKYDIGVWFFSGVAESRLAIRPDGPGRFVATLSARTTGIIDTLLRHRRDRYIARLRLSEDGRRFITESFEKEVVMDGRDPRRSVHTVDYRERTVTWRSWGGGRPDKSGVERIPEGVYTDDPIAAFYNFRFGVYGEIEEGADYSIVTFPKENRIPEISIRIAHEKELKKRKKGGAPADLLADARIDKDLFGSKNGEIEIFFTRDMLPVQAIAKGITFFGDVKGTLSEVIAPGVKKAAEPAGAQSRPTLRKTKTAAARADIAAP